MFGLKQFLCFLRSIAETHYQLGVAQAHCAEYAKAEKSLEAAVAVLNTRTANLKKMGASDNITKELAELTLLCTEIKERTADHKEMQKGTYKEDKDFVSIWSIEGVLQFYHLAIFDTKGIDFFCK